MGGTKNFGGSDGRFLILLSAKSSVIVIPADSGAFLLLLLMRSDHEIEFQMIEPLLLHGDAIF